LLESIKTKLFTLTDDVIAYPGHGPETTIGHEKNFNPYF
jgi:glyoxylase-like metal-dependent hydrolase (beta-lactamase superfamily II)